MSLAKIANGTLLKVGDGASPEMFTTIPEMMKIAGPSIKFDLLDVTSHDSTGYFKEYIPGLADGDKVAGTMNWRPSNTVHKNLRIDSYARTLRNFHCVFPDSTDNTVTFQAYIEEISPTADIGKVLVANLSLKVTGEPSWS